MVANCEQDLTIAKATLQFQELLIKNALTKNLDDPILKAMPVHPTYSSTIQAGSTTGSTEDSIALALRDRIELKESDNIFAICVTVVITCNLKAASEIF